MGCHVSLLKSSIDATAAYQIFLVHFKGTLLKQIEIRFMQAQHFFVSHRSYYQEEDDNLLRFNIIINCYPLL